MRICLQSLLISIIANHKTQQKAISLALDLNVWMIIAVFNTRGSVLILITLFKTMDVQEKKLPLLIYYCFRGIVQPIRNLLCYLGAQYIQIHLERYEEQRKSLPKWVLEALREVRIDKSLLPILIDGGEMIFDVYAIMAYLCYKHERQTLLGSDCTNKARLQEIMEVYTTKQPQSMLEFFKFAQFVTKNSESAIRDEARRLYQYLMVNSNYLKEFCDHIIAHSPEGYVLGELTIIDFLFLQSCIYMLGGFNDIDKTENYKGSLRRTQSNTFSPAISDDTLKCLRVMRDFQTRMMKENFYIEHQDFLESFSTLSPLQSPERIEGVKKFWKGNPKLIQMPKRQ